MKWRQRTALVSERKVPPNPPQKQLNLTPAEKTELVNYLKEVLVNRGEIAGIDMAAKSILKQAQLLLGENYGKQLSPKALMFKLANDLHYLLDELLTPNRKLFFISIKENVLSKKRGGE
jgi:hypothetical protein